MNTSELAGLSSRGHLCEHC